MGTQFSRSGSLGGAPDAVDVDLADGSVGATHIEEAKAIYGPGTVEDVDAAADRFPAEPVVTVRWSFTAVMGAATGPAALGMGSGFVWSPPPAAFSGVRVVYSLRLAVYRAVSSRFNKIALLTKMKSSNNTNPMRSRTSPNDAITPPRPNA